MTEKEAVQQEPLFAARLDRVKEALHNWELEPPGQDEFIRAHAQAMQTDLAAQGPMHEFITMWFATDPAVSSSYAVSKLLRAVQRQLYGYYEGYPEGFLAPEQWQKAMTWILEDADRYGQFVSDVWTRPLQSNKSERYKALKAFSAIARDFGRLATFSVMDVGASQNAGLNHIASGIEFTPVSLIRPGSYMRKPSLSHSAAFSRVLARDLPLENGVGIDITWPADSREWAWSCSHYPGELLDKERVELFNALIDAEYPTVGFFKGDFANFNDVKFRTDFAGKDMFSIVHFCTMLYQASEQDRERMLARADQYAQEFVVVQDFLQIDPDDATHLLFRDNWQDVAFPYRMVVRDLRSKNPRRWHEIFMWHDGRCRELAMGMGRIAVDRHKTKSAWSVLDTIAKRR